MDISLRQVNAPAVMNSAQEHPLAHGPASVATTTTTSEKNSGATLKPARFASESNVEYVLSESGSI